MAMMRQNNLKFQYLPLSWMLTRTGRPCSRHCTPRLTLSPYFRRRAARERGHGRAVQLPNARHLHAAHVLVQHADRNTAPDAAANAARHADDDAARHAAGHATRHAEVDATRHADAVSSTTRIRYEVNIYLGGHQADLVSKGRRRQIL